MAAQPVLLGFALLDFIGAFFLAWPFPGTFMLVMSLIILSKGIWSITSSMRSGFPFDVMGYVDFFAGAVLIILNFGTPLGFAWVVGLIVAIKAIYTLLSSI